MSDTFTILKDTFGKQGCDKKVDGLTVIVDGKLKEVFDTILNTTDKYDNYTDLLSEIMVKGINSIMHELK